MMSTISSDTKDDTLEFVVRFGLRKRADQEADGCGHDPESNGSPEIFRVVGQEMDWQQKLEDKGEGDS